MYRSFGLSGDFVRRSEGTFGGETLTVNVISVGSRDIRSCFVQVCRRALHVSRYL